MRNRDILIRLFVVLLIIMIFAVITDSFIKKQNKINAIKRINIELTQTIQEQEKEIKELKDVITQKDEEIAAQIEDIEEIIEEEPQFFVITEEEREMLATLAYYEAGDTTFDCQCAVISVVFNRLTNGYSHAKTLKDVVYQKHQFSPAYKIKSAPSSHRRYEAVDYVCKYGPTIPVGVMHFRSGHPHKGMTLYKKIGTEYFSY